MSQSTKATHSVAIFKRRGFVVVEVEAETIEAYTEARALRIVSAHPAMVRLGLPVLLAWIDEDDDLAFHGDEDAAEAAEEMDLEYEGIKWTQEIRITWPDVDDEDADDEASEDEDDDVAEDEDEEDEDLDVDDDDDSDDEEEEAAAGDDEDPPVIAPKAPVAPVKPAKKK